ncbi:MAG TPA: hypothetical protein VFL29_00470 [Candidatus Dormibacteraeota bacterium]|nr:hypothetical protein [Candidatus Dormibacteraeota bacterium]
MSRYFTENQMADRGGYGCLARGMTYILIATFAVVGVVILLLGIGWIFSGPISASDYDRAPVCTGPPRDSCKFVGSGTITYARQSASNTEFGVDVLGKQYSNFYTNNGAAELSPGEPVTVEIWRNDVVAITPPDGGRLVTTLEPHVQATNYVLPVVALVMVPFSGWLVWSQLSTVLRARRRLHAARANPPSLPVEVTQFAESLSKSEATDGSNWDVTVTPVPAMAKSAIRTPSVWVGLAVLALPILLVAVTGGHPPTSGRGAGAYWGAVVTLPLLAALLGGALIYQRLFIANVRLASSGGSLSVTEWNRTAHQWARGEVAGVALLTLTRISQSRLIRRVYFLNRKAEVLEQMNGDLFRVADIEALARSLGARTYKNEDGPYDERLVSQLFRKAAS